MPGQLQLDLLLPMFKLEVAALVLVQQHHHFKSAISAPVPPVTASSTSIVTSMDHQLECTAVQPDRLSSEILTHRSWIISL